MVASSKRLGKSDRGVGVSIPFIAGQWSLLTSRPSTTLFFISSFNPLHCGAVVASPWTPDGEASRTRVSIPFIAGQWSLLVEVLGAIAEGDEFQSPSLRGSGRFRSPMPEPTSRRACFNPLHCGAVVASRRHRAGCRRKHVVSIPFIAGQWSLRVPLPRSADRPVAFQSPSLRGSGRFSRGSRRWRWSPPRVSIPFIAGQWSLPARTSPRPAPRPVSIPFIAGQWSLRRER